MSEPSIAVPLFSFAAPAHDRDSERRTDADMLAEAWTDANSRVLVVGPGQVATDTHGLRWLAPADAPEGERAYLGRTAETARLAVLVDEVPDALGPVGVREVATGLAGLDQVDGGLLVHAVGLANWHATHRFCSRCGAPTTVAQAGHTRVCPACGATHFPRTDPAVIMLVTDPDDRALLGRQTQWPPKRFSTLAGFVEPGEPLEAAVRRELAEETGIEVAEVSYAGSQPWPFPSSLMLGFFARAASADIHVDGKEIAEARWWGRAELTRATASGEATLPGPLSISRWLIERWHGGRLDGQW